MKNCENVLRNLNWPLLREQKEYLLNEVANNPDADSNAYNGILNLIDHLQDAAVLDGVATEDEVFGEDRE